MNLGARKVCLVGHFFVGKTSLSRRFHSDTFSEQYLATVGVTVNTKDVVLEDESELRLVVWDLASIEELSALNMNYLRGSAGIVLVADATRKPTLEHALRVKRDIDLKVARLPTVLMINKVDLLQEREIAAEDVARTQRLGIACFETSAKTGAGVNDAFHYMAQLLAKS